MCSSDLVAEEGGGGFDAFEARLGVEKRGETPGEIAHGEGFGAAEVPGGRRGTGEGKRPEDHFIGVRLPDAVDAAIGELDGKSGVDLSGDVHQDAIAELDGVEETDQRDGCARQAGVVLKDAFPADGRVGVFAEGRQAGRFGCALGSGRLGRINIAGGQRHEAGKAFGC